MTIRIAIIGALFFAAVNQTIVSNALAKIISDLGGLDYYSWVFTSFMLTSAFMTVVAGKRSTSSKSKRNTRSRRISHIS